MAEQENKALIKLRKAYQTFIELLKSLSPDAKQRISDKERIKKIQEIFDISPDAVKNIEDMVPLVASELRNNTLGSNLEMIIVMLKNYRDVSYISTSRKDIVLRDHNAKIANAKYTIGK